MKKAFTLIELLVVVSIIALLIAILLPALSAARDSSRAMLCSSNSRQLHVANEAYATDHHDEYIYSGYLGDGQVTINGVSVSRYWVIDKEYLSLMGFTDTQVSNILTGLTAAEIWGARWPSEFLCPQWEKSDNPWAHELSYAHNAQQNSQHILRSNVINPAEKVVFTESQNHFMTTRQATTDGWTQWGESWGDPDNGVIRFHVTYRHDERANFAYYDGHVDVMTYEEHRLGGWTSPEMLEQWDPYY